MRVLALSKLRYKTLAGVLTSTSSCFIIKMHRSRLGEYYCMGYFDLGNLLFFPTVDQREISLYQCLDLFTEPEVLSPEESWYCPQCKEHREATKQLSIWKLPATFIIQLKRFSFRNFIWRDKIDKMVDFPTRFEL